MSAQADILLWLRIHSHIELQKLPPSPARDNLFMLARATIAAHGQQNLMAESTEIDWPGQVAYLRELARIVADEKLSRLDIQCEGMTWTLKAAPTVVAQFAPIEASAPVPMNAPTQAATAPVAVAAPSLVPLPSPMVGVFYLAPSPGEPNFVEIGDRIERGQTIGLIEAMKVFNEITAEASGTLVEIPAGNGQLVETGMPLMLLKS